MIRAAVVRFPGSNCDADTLRAIERAGTEAYYVWHRDANLNGADVVLLPGGFSYGDYLRAGAIARFSPVMASVRRHAEAGGAVIGICNGFQVLCEAGLLPGALIRNDRLRFVSRPVDVRVERSATVCTGRYPPDTVLRLPVAHGEGRYVADEATLAVLEAEGCVVLRYVGAGGNPNGALNDIAGICNPAGTVVGFMPHPERVADPAITSGVGAGFFSSIVSALTPGYGSSPSASRMSTS